MYQAIIRDCLILDVDDQVLRFIEILNDQYDQVYQAIYEGTNYQVSILTNPSGIQVIIVDGLPFEVQLLRPVDQVIETLQYNRRSPAENKIVTAPMPGHVIRIDIAVGQLVKQGSMMLTLEAMKMENTVQSPQEGKIKQIFVSEGQTVMKGEKLLELE